MTLLRFGGGDVIEVRLSVAEVRDVLQTALSTNALLEFEASDGSVVVVNPQQIQFVQEADSVETLGHSSDLRRVREPA